MLQVSRYCVDGVTADIRYRNGIVHVAREAWEDGFAWLARRKDDPDGKTVVILHRDTMLGLQTALAEGFEVEAGGLADRLMRKMVAQGDAERLKPGEMKRRRSARDRQSWQSRPYF